MDRGKTLFRVHGYTVVESEGNLHLAPIVYQITLITLISFISLLNTHTLWYIEDTHFLEVEYIYIFCWELNPVSLKSNKCSFLMINKTEQKRTLFLLFVRVTWCLFSHQCLQDYILQDPHCNVVPLHLKMALHPIGQRLPLVTWNSSFAVSQCNIPSRWSQASAAPTWHTVCSVSLICAWCNIYQLVDSVDRAGSETVCVCSTLLPGWAHFHGNGPSCQQAWRKAQRTTLLGIAAHGPMGLSFPLGSLTRGVKPSLELFLFTFLCPESNLFGFVFYILQEGWILWFTGGEEGVGEGEVGMTLQGMSWDPVVLFCLVWFTGQQCKFYLPGVFLVWKLSHLPFLFAI